MTTILLIPLQTPPFLEENQGTQEILPVYDLKNPKPILFPGWETLIVGASAPSFDGVNDDIKYV